MKVFLFFVTTLVGLDEWTDRKLIAEVNKLVETTSSLVLEISTDEPVIFKKLIPGKNYAVQIEPTVGEKVRKYYYLKAFEITPPIKGSLTYKLILHVTPIE